MLFLNVLLLCLVGTPALAALIHQGNLQIRSAGPQPDQLGPRDGRLAARAPRVARAWPRDDRRLGRRAGPTRPTLGAYGAYLRWRWPKGTSHTMAGTWYLSPDEHDENNVHWACYAIELDFSYNYPIISVLRDKPGELGRIGPITGSEEEIWARLTAGPWRRMPYHRGSGADDVLTISQHNGFRLEHGKRIAPENPPTISDKQISIHILTDFPGIEDHAGNPQEISSFWYGIEDDNRNIIMEIHPDLSLTLYKLPDGAEEMIEIKIDVEDAKKRAVSTWRRMPLKTQIAKARSDELIVRMQKGKLYFDLFREHDTAFPHF